MSRVAGRRASGYAGPGRHHRHLLAHRGSRWPVLHTRGDAPSRIFEQDHGRRSRAQNIDQCPRMLIAGRLRARRARATGGCGASPAATSPARTRWTSDVLKSRSTAEEQSRRWSGNRSRSVRHQSRNLFVPSEAPPRPPTFAAFPGRIATPERRRVPRGGRSGKPSGRPASRAGDSLGSGQDLARVGHGRDDGATVETTIRVTATAPKPATPAKSSGPTTSTAGTTRRPAMPRPGWAGLPHRPQHPLRRRCRRQLRGRVHRPFRRHQDRQLRRPRLRQRGDHSTASFATALNWTVSRCIVVSFADVAAFSATLTTGVGADYDANLQLLDFVFWSLVQSGGVVSVLAGGTAANRGGGVDSCAARSSPASRDSPPPPPTSARRSRARSATA